MELLLETVALFCLKLAYETEGSSPILRDDPVMSDYEREVFGLLVRRGMLKEFSLGLRIVWVWRCTPSAVLIQSWARTAQVGCRLQFYADTGAV